MLVNEDLVSTLLLRPLSEDERNSLEGLSAILSVRFETESGVSTSSFRRGPVTDRYQLVAAEKIVKYFRFTAAGGGVYAREQEGEYSYTLSSEYRDSSLSFTKDETDRILGVQASKGVSGEVTPVSGGYASRYTLSPWEPVETRRLP